jgi:hypothetical protein
MHTSIYRAVEQIIPISVSLFLILLVHSTLPFSRYFPFAVAVSFLSRKCCSQLVHTDTYTHKLTHVCLRILQVQQTTIFEEKTAFYANHNEEKKNLLHQHSFLLLAVFAFNLVLFIFHTFFWFWLPSVKQFPLSSVTSHVFGLTLLAPRFALLSSSLFLLFFFFF